MLDYKKLVNHNLKESREWWQRLSTNEFEKLMKGTGRNTNGTQRVKESDIFHSIHKTDVPKGKMITYKQFCCNIRLQKDEINQTRLTIGGDGLVCDRKTNTGTARLETIKIHLNSTISTKDTKYAAADIGNFYTNLKLDSPEYRRIHLSV